MATKIGINGFGRIGRLVFRTIKARHPDKLEVVAVNDLFDAPTNAHLLKYDSTYGAYDGTVEAKDGHLVVDGKRVTVTAERDLEKIKWGDMGVDLVIESTGLFTDATKARGHVDGRRRQEGHHLRARQERGHHHRPRRQRRQVRSRPSTRWSPTPPAPPMAWRRWRRC